MDERTVRRPEFSGGEWVTLSDGQKWAVPVLDVVQGEPRIWTANGRPQSRGFGLVMEMFGGKIFDPETDWEDVRPVRAALIMILLGCNYTLTDAEGLELVLVGFDRRKDWEGLETAMRHLRDTSLRPLLAASPDAMDDPIR